MAYTGTRSSHRAKTRSPGRTPATKSLVDTKQLNPARSPKPVISLAIQALAEDRPAKFARMRAGELESHLEWVEEACTHGQPQPCESGSQAVFRRHLVELVRQRVTEYWAEDIPDAGTMLQVLQRLEHAQQICHMSGEQSLAAELADDGAANFMVEVAHDLRSPLTSIVFMSEVLHQGQSGPLTGLQRRQLGIVYSAALGLTNLVTDLIEIRHTKRKITDKPTPFAVNHVLGSIYDLVRPLVVEKELRFTLEPLNPDLRLGHPVALSRILLNLTTNALKYTHEGSVTLSAHSVAGSCVQFSVTDTGPGIPDEAVEMLFQPFRHEPQRETGYAFSGTGLGLAICQRLVTSLGSQLLVETSSRGTRFTFDLELPPASSV